MAIQFKKTKLAAAVATVAVGLGLSAAANAVVVVGGDNGWEVSFDGNINAFYTQGNYDPGYSGLGLVAPTSANPVANSGGASSFVDSNTGLAATGLDAARVTSGFLPAFFSFNVKSPTVNGMTGSARFSFAPQISNANIKNQLYGGVAGQNSQGIQGSSIDTREVLVNLDGGFGTVSYGRTLSIFGRQAILKDMTLFGVGQVQNDPRDGAVTSGRIGRGYTYPNFNARFSYKTPNLSGLQAEIGLYDPSIDQLNGSNITGLLNQTDTPRFEGELSYTAAFSGGSAQFWADGLWQDIENTAAGASSDVSVQGWGVGAEAKMMGFAMTGYYYGGSGLGRSLQFLGGTACNSAVTINGTTFAPGTSCEATDNDGYYLQGTYTFSGKTKFGASYGQSTEDAYSNAIIRAAGLSELQARDAELSMWTVGVYHDVSSWLKVIAEYSHSMNDYGANVVTLANGADTEADTFSVGSFFFW